LADTGGPKTPPAESDKARWRSDLRECLRTYDALGGWRDAEEVIRREIVKGFVKKVSLLRTASPSPNIQLIFVDNFCGGIVSPSFTIDSPDAVSYAYPIVWTAHTRNSLFAIYCTSTENPIRPSLCLQIGLPLAAP